MFDKDRLTLFLLISCCVLANAKYQYEIKEYSLPIDHFNFIDNKTFQMRYLLNASFATNVDSPFFFYTGNEGDIEVFAQNTGFLWELAAELKACVVFAEHRYYGASLPFGASTFNDSSNLGFLSVEQTLEDFASLIDFLRNGTDRPVIAFGGSYGGMLAAWLRIKFPHLVEGALAASAPVLQFNGLAPCDIFFKITTSVFASYSLNCSKNIKDSWSTLQNLSLSEEGKNKLNKSFKFCKPIKQQDDLNKFFDYLEDVYGNLAMTNYPYDTGFIVPLPAYPVREFCLHLNEYFQGDELLRAMQKAVNLYSNFTGHSDCLDYNSADGQISGDTWEIQTCNQMVMPMCSDQTMFRNKKWDFKAYSEHCLSKYKIVPKLNDMVFRYGGKNLRSASNIIFSNGLLDPWSGGGILQNSNNEIVIIIIPEGAHHLDLRASNKFDPESVKEARKQETKIINNWINNFFKSNHIFFN